MIENRQTSEVIDDKNDTLRRPRRNAKPTSERLIVQPWEPVVFVSGGDGGSGLDVCNLVKGIVNCKVVQVKACRPQPITNVKA